MPSVRSPLACGRALTRLREQEGELPSGHLVNALLHASGEQTHGVKSTAPVHHCTHARYPSNLQVMLLAISDLREEFPRWCGRHCPSGNEGRFG